MHEFFSQIGAKILGQRMKAAAKDIDKSED